MTQNPLPPHGNSVGPSSNQICGRNRVFDPSQLITLPGTWVRLLFQEYDSCIEINMISSSAKSKYSQEALNAEALESRPTVANVAPQIEKGLLLLLPAADQDFPLIAYRLDGSPIYHSVFTPAALAPLIERGVLLPAVERSFAGRPNISFNVGMGFWQFQFHFQSF